MKFGSMGTVDTLAQAFHLSASSLQRRLAEEGTTASRCVREARLLTAMALLQGSDLQVSEIAVRCGYQSHSRFTAAFRQRFSGSPVKRIGLWLDDRLHKLQRA